MKKVRAEMTIIDTVWANKIENERQYQWLAKKKRSSFLLNLSVC
jgi:hypothetical protein